MRKGNGLREYFYEFLFQRTIEKARVQTGEIIPISVARHIRSQVSEALMKYHGESFSNPHLSVKLCLGAIDHVCATARNAEGELLIPGYQAQYPTRSMQDASYQKIQQEFMDACQVNNPESGTGFVFISPYDPRWADRAVVKRAGTRGVVITDRAITQSTRGLRDSNGETLEGTVAALHTSDFGDTPVCRAPYKKNADGFEHAGQALSDEDRTGLTRLMNSMSREEYDAMRPWVLEGFRERGGHRMMSTRALDRSCAMLDELKRQGLAYRVERDREVGQVKAVIEGSKLELRLIDPKNDRFAGARLYNDGQVIRFSTDHRVTGGMELYDPSPEDAVKLLHFAQGATVSRPDGRGYVGQTTTTHTVTSKRGTREIPDSYIADNGRNYVAKYNTYTNARGQTTNANVFMRREARIHSLPQFFKDAEYAETFLRQAVESAHDNVTALLDVENMIAYVDQARSDVESDAEIEPPEYASDDEIARIQHEYFLVLTGQRDTLLRPGASQELYEESVDTDERDFSNFAYSGTPEEKVRDHAADVTIDLIGHFDPEPHIIDGEIVDKRFDPQRVARYMTGSKGQFGNLDDIAAAARACDIDPEHMLGVDFRADRFRDRLIQFDPITAQDMTHHPSPFIRAMGEHIRDTLQRSVTKPTRIEIDDAGVVSWAGQQLQRNGSTKDIEGTIGQIFDVGEYGEICTKFASGANHLVVPGYRANISAPQPGHSYQSVEERTVVRGYEQIMRDHITQQLSHDVISGRTQVGEPASINKVYAELYGTKHPEDYLERAQVVQINERTGEVDSHIDPFVDHILRTEAKRVRYDNVLKEESTIYAEYASRRDKRDPADDNYLSTWDLTGKRNMAVLTGKDTLGRDIPGGFFDPVMTGGGTNQGIVRFLTEDARVDSRGKIIPGDPSTLSGSRTPLMTMPEMATLEYDAFDRQQMTGSTVLQSARVTEPCQTALMTFGGWTADDPIVVSKRFAEKHHIIGVDGQPRSLVVGDKLSDLHGNKGVISLVVDPDMDLDEAREHDIEQEVQWFKHNPDLDVVMSPFSLISRRNAGSARELMSGTVTDLHSPDGEVTPGGIGEMRFAITHMSVDTKSRVYDDEEVRAGHGRKASSQLAWAIQGRDCPAIMREFYGHNSSAEANLREYLTVCGLGLEADGTLYTNAQTQLNDQTGRFEALRGQDAPQRRRISFPELVYTRGSEKTKPVLNTTKMRQQFGEYISTRGGDLDIPFSLTFPTGEELSQVGHNTWQLPVLSSHLRSGQEFADGSVVFHDYTRNYQEIFIETCRYRDIQEKLDAGDFSNDQYYAYHEELSAIQRRAQRQFDTITSDVQKRVFSGKHNIFRQGIQTSRLADSATMVWTADPRLNIDEVAISTAKAEQMGLADGDYALIWRDPLLRSSGVAYMKVTCRDDLTGAAINPVMDKQFDGDFDGDAIAVVKLHTQAARDEAMEKFSVSSNLLDRGVKSERGTHPLTTHVSLDTQVALSKRPELHDSLAKLSGEAILNHQGLHTPGSGNPRLDESIRERCRAGNIELVGQLSDFYRDAQRHEFGSALRFDDPTAHMRSLVDVCVTTGAKGSMSKAESYARYLGLTSEKSVEETLASHGTFTDTQRTGITAEDHEASMYATAMKAHSTGVAGAFSQRAVRALRSTDLEAVLEITSKVTQSTLQSKHSATDARHKNDMLHGPGRALWRGHAIERQAPGKWVTVYCDGQPQAATVGEWIEQATDFYTASDGFNVEINADYIERVAHGLADPHTGVMRNLETHPELEGTVLDRLAYGGTFDTVVENAQLNTNLYAGRFSSQFASAVTRQNRKELAAQLNAPESVAEITRDNDPVDVKPSQVKKDVLAETVPKSKVRGAGRTSSFAVGVSHTQPSTPDSDYEMEF